MASADGFVHDVFGRGFSIGVECGSDDAGGGGGVGGSQGAEVIVGLGVDIAEVGRIQGAIERYGETFLRRIYTEREREDCERFKNKYERYAARCAAKEAAMKELGAGWRRGGRSEGLEGLRAWSA